MNEQDRDAVYEEISKLGRTVENLQIAVCNTQWEVWKEQKAELRSIRQLAAWAVGLLIATLVSIFVF